VIKPELYPIIEELKEKGQHDLICHEASSPIDHYNSESFGIWGNRKQCSHYLGYKLQVIHIFN